MQLREYIEKAHQTAVEKGWWENPRSWRTQLTLVLSELFEAFEAFRGGFYAKSDDVVKCTKLLESGSISGFSVFFKNHVKNSFEDEIADAVIRLFDMMGKQELYLQEIEKMGSCVKGEFDGDVRSAISLCTPIFEGVKMDAFAYKVLLGYLFAIADAYSFDLLLHIRLKMAYNDTRSYRHGGKIV